MRSIDRETVGGSRYRERLIHAIRQSLHSSLRTLDDVVLYAETPQFKLRIDWLAENNFRYAAWARSKQMSERPDLVIKNGVLRHRTMVLNYFFVFSNQGYTYEVSIHRRRESGSPPASLSIYKGQKQILYQGVTHLEM